MLVTSLNFNFSKIFGDNKFWDNIVKIYYRAVIVTASLTCLPFGLMLGWPSPTNPILIKDDSPIRISMDQSAMIAGFLMIGNAVGTPFSTKGCLRTKFNLLAGIIIMSTGWILMWQSRSIYWLLGSRFLVGVGNGYVTGQLKIYISETCDDDLKIFLTKSINLFVFLGMILIYSFGPFIDFRHTSIACLLICLVIFFVGLLLPMTPKELLRAGRFDQAKRSISILKQGANVNDEIYKINETIAVDRPADGLCELMKDKTLRSNFFKFATLVFFQQFTGAPSTIIYTQILLANCRCPYPEYFAIAYVVVFFICNVFGIFFIPKFDRRATLLLSTAGVALLTATNILVLSFDVNDKYWTYTSTAVLFLFIIVHTLGLGNVPVTFIPDLFPSSYRTSVAHFFLSFHSILALIITKIFQVLMTQYNVSVPFYLFTSVSCMTFVFIYFFVKSKTEPCDIVSVDNNCEIKNKTVE